MNMGPDYSKARSIEEARAIRNAFWDQIHKEIREGKWREVPREEFDRIVEEMRNRRLKAAEEKMRKQSQEKRRGQNDTSDHAA